MNKITHSVSKSPFCMFLSLKDLERKCEAVRGQKSGRH